MRRVLSLIFAGWLFSALPLGAQQLVQELRADLLTGGASSAGRVILAGEQMVFISDTNPTDSFFVARSNIQSATPDRETLTLQLRDPIRDRSGDRLRLTFRLLDDRSSSAVNVWHSRGAGAPFSAGAGPAAVGPASPADSAGTQTYQARHKRRFGGSTGRLIVSDSGIAYESIDNASSSRRWEFRDIREMKLKNPYEIEIVAAGGEKYTLELQGQGMDTGDYNALIDRVTKARAVR
jgi:hypothetical protein